VRYEIGEKPFPTIFTAYDRLSGPTATVTYIDAIWSRMFCEPE
jgi:hypothetical protein